MLAQAATFSQACLLARTRYRFESSGGPLTRYNIEMQRKIFWTVFIALGLIADFTLPLLWGLLATIPIGIVSWWVAYRSEWF
jgi:hypothetical protein